MVMVMTSERGNETIVCTSVAEHYGETIQTSIFCHQRLANLGRRKASGGKQSK